MNTLLKVGLIAGLLLSGPSFAAENITRADQIPQLHEDPQDATVSERVTSRFTRSHYRQFDLDGASSRQTFKVCNICKIYFSLRRGAFCRPID